MTLISPMKCARFYEAATNGDLSTVKALSLDPEVKLDWKGSEYGYTPFSCACEHGHVDIVRYLLSFHDNQREIDCNLEDDLGSTPFYCACYGGHEKVVEILLGDRRIDVNRANGDGRTPLWWASYFGHVGIVRRMLASDQEVDVIKRDSAATKMTAAEVARGHVKLPLETGNSDAQERKQRGLEISTWLEAYEKDPLKVRARFRRELSGRLAGELFALVVFLADGYLGIHREAESKSPQWIDEHKFFSLALQMPMDLQMVLCNRVFGLPDSVVTKSNSEEGFKKFSGGW